MSGNPTYWDLTAWSFGTFRFADHSARISAVDTRRVE